MIPSTGIRKDYIENLDIPENKMALGRVENEDFLYQVPDGAFLKSIYRTIIAHREECTLRLEISSIPESCTEFDGDSKYVWLYLDIRDPSVSGMAREALLYVTFIGKNVAKRPEFPPVEAFEILNYRLRCRFGKPGTVKPHKMYFCLMLQPEQPDSIYMRGLIVKPTFPVAPQRSRGMAERPSNLPAPLPRPKSVENLKFKIVDVIRQPNGEERLASAEPEVVVEINPEKHEQTIPSRKRSRDVEASDSVEQSNKVSSNNVSGENPNPLKKYLAEAPANDPVIQEAAAEFSRVVRSRLRERIMAELIEKELDSVVEGCLGSVFKNPSAK